MQRSLRSRRGRRFALLAIALVVIVALFTLPASAKPGNNGNGNGNGNGGGANAVLGADGGNVDSSGGTTASTAERAGGQGEE